MEYTKDVIINVKYGRKICSLGSKLHNMANWVQKDNYFKITMLISIFALGLDYLIIKKFIEIVSLL